jgi:hypothetical protein
MTKRHLLILLLVTLVTRGGLYISYPLGAPVGDDDQSAHRHQISQVVGGNLLIGNLRYHTGYPLVIAPAAAVSELAGRLDERLILLAQVGLSSLIPFLIYDILRQRRSPGEALVVALVVALDPFGLQWAHFYLPNWLIALCFVLGLWFIHQGLLHRQRLLIWVALAGVTLGIGALARLNVAPVIAVLGLAFFLLRDVTRAQQLRMFITLGASSTVVLLLYLLAIHYPSTGTMSFSCYTGTNMLVSVYLKDFDLTPDNGPATRHYLQLLTLKPPREIIFTSDIYPRWSEPESWATPEEYAAFINQPYGVPASEVTSVFPAQLYYYLGPCETDQILLAVHNEAVKAQPLRWLVSIPVDVLNMLVQRQSPDNIFIDPMYLPRYERIRFEGEKTLGFLRAYGDYYNGHIVWAPGIRLYSHMFNIWNLFKWLAPLAVVWALLSRDWFYRVSALLLLSFLVLLSVFGNPAARLYAPMYPLTPLLIGGLAVFLARKWRETRRGKQEN